MSSADANPPTPPNRTENPSSGIANQHSESQNAEPVVHPDILGGTRYDIFAPLKRAKIWGFELENRGSVARDHLANERTYLAWLRSSLGLASSGIAVTQLFRLTSQRETKLGPNLNEVLEDPALERMRQALIEQARILDTYINGQQAKAFSDAALVLQKRSVIEAQQRVSRYAYLAKPIGGSFIGLAFLFIVIGTTRYFNCQNQMMKTPSQFPPARKSVAITALFIVSIIFAAFTGIMRVA